MCNKRRTLTPARTFHLKPITSVIAEVTPVPHSHLQGNSVRQTLFPQHARVSWLGRE